MAGLALPATVYAQEEGGQLWDVQVMSVQPADMMEFMATAGRVKAAAEAANLGAEYGWYLWVRGFDVAIASMAPNMATFDDPEAWMRAFQGTPGEAMVQEAMNKFMTQISIQSGEREALQEVPAWSYEPATPAFETPSFAYRHDFWIAPGKGDAFDQVARKIAAFSKANEGHYPVTAYRTRFGDTGRVTFLVFVDNWADFYGENSMERKIQGTPSAQEWEGILGELFDCLSAYEGSQMEYHAELSYTGPGM
jgi:hypothetical protein